MKKSKISPNEFSIVLDFITQIFSQQPFLPGAIEGKKRTKIFMSIALNFLKKLNSFRLFSLKNNHEEFIGAAITADFSDHGSRLRQLVFALYILFRLGFRTLQALLKAGKARPSFKDKILELHVLAVHPELQGKGIGSSLLKMINDYMMKEGYKGLVFFVECNSAAYSFYRKAGCIDLNYFTVSDMKFFWMKKEIS
ncbi:MAG: GNAT family N-acetyltransferase [Chitinophagaceae bacterium]|nr:GNAT family N-acetyltransferase [Chitinophagaceae bacterium]